MLIAIFPLIVAIVGLLVWALAARPLVKRAGEIMFFVGMLVLTAVLASYTIRIG